MKTRVALLLCGLVLALGLCALGAWQLRRATDKEAILAAVAEVMAERNPRPLSTVTGRAGGYDWVAARGHFLPTPVLLLDNQRRGAAVGVHVLGVFASSNGDSVLVDLGWLALPGDRRLPEVVLPAGELALAGLLSPPPSTGIALGPAVSDAAASRWLLTRVEIPALSSALHRPLATRLLRLDPALPFGFARDLDVLPNTLPPERHRAYAVQWFGLAIACLVSFFYLGFRRRP